MFDTRLSSSITSLCPLFLQSILCSRAKSVSSMSTQLSDFLDALVSLENVSDFSETTKDYQHESLENRHDCGFNMYINIILILHINVHFLLAKVLVSQVFSTVS